MFVVTGRDEGEMDTRRRGVPQADRLYASMPTGGARPAMASELQPELRRLSLDGAWDAMANLVDDDMLCKFAVVALIDRVANGVVATLRGCHRPCPAGIAGGTPEPVIAAVLEDVDEND